MERLAAAFTQPDPLEGLDEFIATFARFWSADRLATRRLRSLAALDPDFTQVVRARDERRRQGLGVLLGRLAASRGAPVSSLDDVRDMLFTLTSFETFDSLAGPTRSPEEVAPVVSRLARAALGL
jgi:hypothetical protein